MTVMEDKTMSVRPIVFNWAIVSNLPLKALMKIFVSQSTISDVPIALPSGGTDLLNCPWIVLPDAEKLLWV